MTNHFYQLRHSQLDPALTFKLAPFIISQRPFDLGPVLTWQDMKKEGNSPIEHVTCGQDEINEDITSTNSITFDHDDDTRAFITRPDITSSDWLTTKINHWKSQTAAKCPTQ